MIKATISQMFDYFPGNHGLTEEIIYEFQPISDEDSIPIFSGSQNNVVPIGKIRKESKNKMGEDIRFFENECLILTKDGSAGMLTYRNQGVFTLNHHACVLKVKENWKGKIDPEWFAQQFQSHLLQVVTSKSDNRVFSTKWFERIEFLIPSYPIQFKQKTKKKTLIKIKKQIDLMIKDILYFLNLNIKIKKYEYGSHLISEVFDIKGGNNGLTEKFIYHNLPSNDEEKIEILTSATLERTAMGFISKTARLNNRKLKIFESPAILVARNGYAGIMKYISTGKFTTNDHAYVFTPKKEWKDKINLKYFILEYQKLFWEIVTSKSDNATFSKEYAERQMIKLPHIDVQNEIIQKITPFKMLLKKLQIIEKKIDKLLEYSIY